MARKKTTKKKTTKKKVAKKKATKKTSPKKSALSKKEAARLSKEEAIEKYRLKNPIPAPVAIAKEVEDDGIEKTPLDENSPDGKPVETETSAQLSDEYNPDDEPEDGADMGYGWGYDASLDDPEELSTQQELVDEDERYALGLDKD